MIIKWQSDIDQAWHVTDGVTDVINHGFVDFETLYEHVRRYDGEGGAYVTNLDSPDEDLTVCFYLVVTVRGERQHWKIHSIRQGYLLSDDGKTVDRLLH